MDLIARCVARTRPAVVRLGDRFELELEEFLEVAVVAFVVERPCSVSHGVLVRPV
jgi:hypothetical protein